VRRPLSGLSLSTVIVSSNVREVPPDSPCRWTVISPYNYWKGRSVEANTSRSTWSRNETRKQWIVRWLSRVGNPWLGTSTQRISQRWEGFVCRFASLIADKSTSRSPPRLRRGELTLDARGTEIGSIYKASRFYRLLVYTFTFGSPNKTPRAENDTTSNKKTRSTASTSQFLPNLTLSPPGPV
jgi:hypothetical protein